jgi:uncharacterized protein YjiS (DUF1127 family)
MTSIAAVATNRPGHTQATDTTDALGTFGSLIVGMVRRIGAAHGRARTLRILKSLDDRALRDIGLTRSQIDSVEQDPRYRPRYARS